MGSGAVLLTLALALSCASTTPFVVTGESLDYVGNQFADTAKLMDAALEKGTVSVETYRGWATFVRKFQLLYPVSLQAWESSRRMNDVAKTQQTLAIITQLVQELSDFYQVAIKAISGWNPDGGMPWTP
jgi:hypothetical protein